MKEAILVINAGSSSIKFALFAYTKALSGQHLLYRGVVDGIGTRARLSVTSNEGSTESPVDAPAHLQALQIILNWLEQEASDLTLVAAGHRVVHGGTAFARPVRLGDKVQKRLRSLVPLAPLHQPHALQAIEALDALRPQLLQVACFDTAFHADMPQHEQRFALPVALVQQGIRRYGFHGLSYEYITSVLPAYLGEGADDKVVIAHLGHGVSMCAVNERQSIATTMSFTPLDGLPMGTRSGAIDPAIVLYLLKQGMTGEEVSEVLHHQSGLLGVSGISGDMRTLLASEEPDAAGAVDLFCYRVARELGSLSVALGGLDAVVFTGGIGEHAAPVRAKVCQLAACLGLAIDAEANRAHASRISAAHSPVSVWVIPTNEEQVIAGHTAAVIGGGYG